MSGIKKALVVGLCLAAAFSLLLLGVPRPPQQGAFREYLESNDRFGTKFFKDLHAAAPDKNTVFSPLGIYSFFACLRELAGWDEELDRAFGWRPGQELGSAHRQLMARFTTLPPLLPERERSEAALKRYRELEAKGGDNPWKNFEMFYRFEERKTIAKREELRLDNSIRYHGPLTPRAFQLEALRRAKEDFGLELAEVSDDEEWREIISGFPGGAALLDEGQGGRIFFLTSTLHLGTKWEFGLFLHVESKQRDFYPKPGSPVTVRMVTSELTDYPYARTDDYEAVVLPAMKADFVVVMPEPGRSLGALEERFADSPDLLASRLERRCGDVELPEFKFKTDYSARPILEGLGVRTVFKDLGRIVLIPDSRFIDVRQAVSIVVDADGIQADSETASIALLGGMRGGERPFHMKVNRPFLFQIRDNMTGALLFMGAVVDPSRHDLN